MKHLLVAFLVIAGAATLGIATARAARIAPALQAALVNADPAAELAVIVTLRDKVDVRRFNDRNRRVRRAKLVSALKRAADSGQRPLLSLLQAERAGAVKQLWAINGIALRARPQTLHALARRSEIEAIYIDRQMQAPPITYAAGDAPAWNIDAVRAPALWSHGVAGAGVVIASLDTGVDRAHPALAAAWRGGGNSWFDPNGEHALPYDGHGHGTQTMGIMAGDGGEQTALSVAPQARWIAVKIFNDAGNASLSNIHLGLQWLLDPDGNPATDDAPDVVNNSWGLSVDNTCTLDFQDDIRVLKAAGIAVAFAAGNAGPNGSTSVSPANNPDGFPVGAVNASLTVSSFSSRGPSACTGVDVYPGLTAPGEAIVTTDLSFDGTARYASVSGTSYSSPHLAGVMALLIGAFPNAPVQALEAALKQSARDLGPPGPDSEYGYGLLDADRAYAALAAQDTDADGYSLGSDCNDNDSAIHPGATETKHDGIDQDCNGYDHTLEVRRVLYDSRRDFLSVEASSSLGARANLRVDGFGAMRWQSGRWVARIKRPLGDPGQVTVSGVEGSATASTQAR